MERIHARPERHLYSTGVRRRVPPHIARRRQALLRFDELLAQALQPLEGGFLLALLLRRRAARRRQVEVAQQLAQHLGLAPQDLLRALEARDLPPSAQLRRRRPRAGQRLRRHGFGRRSGVAVRQRVRPARFSAPPVSRPVLVAVIVLRLSDDRKRWGKRRRRAQRRMRMRRRRRRISYWRGNTEGCVHGWRFRELHAFALYLSESFLECANALHRIARGHARSPPSVL